MPAARAAPLLLLAVLAVCQLWAPVAAARHPAALRQRDLKFFSDIGIAFYWTTDYRISLTFVSNSLSHGEYCDSGSFTDIPAGASEAQIGCLQSAGMFTGVEGTATFALNIQGGISGCTLTLNYDYPEFGSNSYSCNVSDQIGCDTLVSCSVTNGGGNVATPTVSVQWGV